MRWQWWIRHWNSAQEFSFKNSRLKSERKKSMRIRVWIAKLALTMAVAAMVVAIGGRSATVEAQQTAAGVEVKIDNFSFGPTKITVPAGTTVTWTNRDDIPHTVVSDDKVFKSKVLDTDEKFSYTFSKPGTYPYFCSVHPKMTGVVVVQ
jgi:plastocyanin